MIGVAYYEANAIVLKSNKQGIFDTSHESRIIFSPQTNSWHMELNLYRVHVAKKFENLKFSEVIDILKYTLCEYGLSTEIFVHEIHFYMKQIENRFSSQFKHEIQSNG